MSPAFVSSVFGPIQATHERCSELLEPLLRELQSEPCAHSWQPGLARVAPSDVYTRFETILASDRPGRLFTYFRTVDGRREAVAIGVVSDGVTSGFPERGLPVVGRAYVRPAYRRCTLYSAVLAHRLAFCRERWGDGLRAIHLGTAEPGVERTFRRLHAGRLVHLGDEDLGSAGTVRALLGLSPRFEERLRDPVPPPLRREQTEVLAFFDHGPGRKRIAHVAGAMARLGERHQGYRALHEFVRHLPDLR